MAVSRWAVDAHAPVHQPLARGVDVGHSVREVPEVATALELFRIPVVGELDLGLFVAFGGKENECEAPGLDIDATLLDQSEVLSPSGTSPVGVA